MKLRSREFALILAISLLSGGLGGCDIFYEADYAPSMSDSAYTAPSGSDGEKFLAHFKEFAQHYSLRCQDNPPNGVLAHCWGEVGKINGRFDVGHAADGSLIIHFFEAQAGGPEFFSHDRYCAHYAEAQQALEPFMGPLHMTQMPVGRPCSDQQQGTHGL